MEADNFSLKARRTTRIPLRIPVIVVFEERGRSRSLDGWTMIVNVHGARIECKRVFEEGDEVLIQVPFSGKAERGKIVWRNSEVNKNGNFEFGVELTKPENLWGVGFPPSDWQTNRAASKPAEPYAAEPAPVDAPGEPSLQSQPNPVTSSDDQVDVPACEPAALLEPAIQTVAEAVPAAQLLPISGSGPAALDLSWELSAEVLGLNDSPWGEEIGPVLQPQASQVGVSLYSPESDSGTPASAEADASFAPIGFGPMAPEISPSRNVPAAVSAEPVRRAAVGIARPAGATDRLSAIFDELVESALQARLSDVVQGLGARVEARIADIEIAAVNRLEQRIQGAVLRQSESLEKRAADILTSRQLLLEQNVRSFLDDAETSVKSRQQSFLEENRQAFRNELTELMAASSGQLHREAATLLSATRLSLRQTVEQEYPAIERQVGERCRAQAEQILAGHLEQWGGVLSERMQEAGQSLSQRIEEMVSENTARLAAKLEAQSGQYGAQACAQLEQQLEQVQNQVRQAFLRHIVSELNSKQQLWIQDGRRSLEDVAEQCLYRARQNLSQVLKEIGESFLREAYQEGGVPAEVAPACADQNCVPAAEQPLLQAEAGPRS